MLSLKLQNRLSLEPVARGNPGPQGGRGDLGFTGAQYFEVPMPLRNLSAREWAAGVLDKVSPGHWLRQDTYHCWYVTTQVDAERLVQHLSKSVADLPVGFDYETRNWAPRAKLKGLLGGAKVMKGLSPVHPSWAALPVTFQISWGQATYIVSGALLYLFVQWLTQVARLDGANFGFEIHVSRNVGVMVQRFEHDVLQMHYNWDEIEHQRYATLKDITNLYLGLEAADFKDTFDLKGGETYESVLVTDTKRAVAYGGFDPLISTWDASLFRYLLSTRDARPGYDGYELYKRWERPTQSAVTRMEETGFPLNSDAAKVHHRAMTEEISDLDASAYKVINRPINLSSPKELCAYYYDEKKLPVVLTTGGHTCLLCKKVVTKKTNGRCPIHGRGALVNTASVDDQVLERFAKKKDPLAIVVQKRRTIDKARGTWVDGYYKYSGNKPYGFPSIRTAHVVSGRLAAGIWLTTPEYLRSILGLPQDAIELEQAIFKAMTYPKGTDLEKERAKVAASIQHLALGKLRQQRLEELCAYLGLEPQELVLIGADYSQLELRILTQVTGDPMMAEAFLKNRDLHSWTGALLEAFRRSGVAALTDMKLCESLYDEIKAAHDKSDDPFAVLTDYEKKLIKVRKGAKSTNFGLVYGMGADKLAAELDCTLLEAQQIFDIIWSMYSTTKAYYDEAIKEVTKLGEMRTLLGRNRRIPELKSSKPGVRGYGERLVKNSPCQCGAADVIRGAMLQVDLDMEAGGMYGTYGRGAYGRWVEPAPAAPFAFKYSHEGNVAEKSHWVPDWATLPKGWATHGLPPALATDLGALGRWGFRMVLQCHDELVLIGPKKYAAQARARLKAIMEDPFGGDLPMSVPLVVKTGEGMAWSSLK